MILKVAHLDFSFGKRQILKDISFEVGSGEFLSILGPNGVGKTTLFRCILNLLTPGAGAITVDGEEVSGMSAQKLAKTIAYIPQSHSPTFNFSVLDMVLMGTAAQVSSLSSPGREQRELARSALARLQIEHLAEHPYGFCSGGEKQLCLLARAIAQQARILVMDEPSASLDFGNRIKVMETIRGLVADGYAVVQTTHDPEQAYLYSDKILALRGGQVLAWGTPKEVMTASLMSQLYGISVEVCSMHDDDVRVCLPARPV